MDKEIRVKVPEDLHDWLQAKAERMLLSVSDVVRQAILLAKKQDEVE
jgi:Arc/MetJ-type ribon-helix-helix transcriptional regulator